MSQVTPFVDRPKPRTQTEMVRPTTRKLHGLGGKTMSAIRKQRKLERQRKKAGRR